MGTIGLFDHRILLRQFQVTYVLILSILLTNVGIAQCASPRTEFGMAKRGAFPVQVTKAGQVSNSQQENEEALLSQRARISNAETDVFEKELQVNSAELKLKEYVDGLFVIERMAHRIDVDAAEGNVELLKEELEAAKAANAPTLEIKRITLTLQAAKNNLELAKTKLEVFENLSSEVVKTELHMEIRMARVRLQQSRELLVLEKRKLELLEANIQD